MARDPILGKRDAATPQPLSSIAGQQPHTSEWLTASEAAAYLKVKRRTLLVWVRQHKVKAYPLSGTKRMVWRFLRADLDAALLGSACVLSFATPFVPAAKGEQ